ncbi:MAG: Nucleoside phosphorylase [Bacteroidetes bacterium]|nr:Nucleoside phosphorylase [Bacteroidota bacterium]
MKKIVVTFALKAEFIPLTFPNCEIIYVFTGIGKAKAAMMLTKAIMEEDPDLVVNIGTSGTLNHQVGDIFVCNRFIDRDFLTVQLPGIEYEIGFQEVLADEDIIKNWISTNATLGVCNTGDSFVTQAESICGDVVDMEAFAQAIVCKELSKPFLAVKYVTDIIGENSVKHWEDKLSDAREGLAHWFANR